jgi:hypothetical protein
MHLTAAAFPAAPGLIQEPEIRAEKAESPGIRMNDGLDFRRKGREHIAPEGRVDCYVRHNDSFLRGFPIAPQTPFGLSAEKWKVWLVYLFFRKTTRRFARGGKVIYNRKNIQNREVWI